MTTPERPQAVRVPIEALESASDLTGANYIDAFELTPSTPDHRTPEQIARAALEGTPFLVRNGIRLIHRHVLRFDLHPTESTDHVLGWRVLKSTEQEVLLRAEGPLMEGRLLLNRRGSRTLRLVTSLRFRRPGLSRSIWTLVGPIHRLAAPRLMERAARGVA